MRGFEIDSVFSAFEVRANEAPRVDMARIKQGSYDRRGEAFAVGHDGIGGFRGEFSDEMHALEDSTELIEAIGHALQDFFLAMGRQNTAHHLVVAGMEFVEHREIIGCGVDGFCGECDELIGYSAEGRNNDDGRRIKAVDNLLNLQHGFGRAHGGAAEFEDFHRGTILK